MSAAKYYIYRNLRTGGFSVKYKGKVVYRDHSLCGVKVEFKVSELGRQRVIKEKSKNVHAYAACVDFGLDGCSLDVDRLPVISYNPYKSKYFTCNGKKINNATVVAFRNGKCYLVK